MAHHPPKTFTPHSKHLAPTTRLVGTRTEDEIVQHILSHRPVAHQKNVWAFWDRGWDAIRPWTKRNIIDWVRRLGPEWEVRVLDVVPDSPRHVRHFVDESLLPPAFNNFGHEHAGQHKSDILRLPLLYLHGGVWIDVGGILTRHLDDLWCKIEDPNDPTEVVGISTTVGSEAMPDRALGNTFIAAAKGTLFIRLWHEVFSAVMNDRTSSLDARLDPLFTHLTPFAFPSSTSSSVKIPVEAFADYVAQFTAAGRLFALVDPSIGWDGPRFFQENLMLFNMDEMFIQNFITDWSGEVQFAHLSRPRNEPVDHADLDQLASQEFVETCLGNSLIIKLSQGLIPEPIPLAKIWNRPENENADIAAGTWAEYLRWGSVHLDQRRPLAPISKEAKAALLKRAWTAGVLEIIDEATPVRDVVLL
ncbi:hypothetical protein EXIGLDRAFT_775399 [Exidia glandulosa HHB12029]|uniref:Capsule polysaccharide biosynthesis protein n=1 Tax=Exidia glandulosa HHB12029 TaxID=1314781 RepID=A0A165DXV3_EXIGL|nr:hypothetical protein EXIGLDRAFT_775399 [Exidia glandulosa HHB12029]